MTVKELINKLQELPQELEVVTEFESVEYVEKVEIREPDYLMNDRTVIVISNMNRI